MRVNEGHQITLKYFFTYSGKAPLTIIEPEVDCSCTKVIFPTDKITTGTQDSVIIKFDTNNKIGWQERDVILQFTSESLPKSIEKVLTFKGMVKASKATKKAYKLNKTK